ncbi:hypothetical protein VTK73DRAFT_3055 [Phialemonium thermophilum]|uniref:Zn(2)-C6 fungal-type domain-containing protein n=1 Tax=Phialemonium thermophilum TaxID=223376 RepID=A0ABR3X1U8_9PEZI
MPATARNTTSKRRARVACRFCRQRKLKCNNNQPSCGNCEEHGKVCSYDELPKRPRPSNSRIAALEEENKRLQATVRRLQSEDRSQSRETESASPRDTLIAPSSRDPSPLPGPRSPSPSYGSNDQGPTPPVPTSRPSPSILDVFGPAPAPQSPRPRTKVHGPGDLAETHYHGPTSTLFDDSTVQEARARHLALHNRQNASTTWIRKGLFAEAASQRHLETINLAAGRLDFDGVDPELGMHLLELHWNRQHHSFLITYRPAFMRDMACGGPYFSRLLLNAIFFGASKFSNRLEVRRDPNDVRTAGWLFRERVRELLVASLDRSDITTIQALLVMTSSLFALGDERSAAWLYAGTAFRMIIDLGLHVDAERMSNFRHLTDEDLEIRRRVFWGAFVVDKIQSLYQGRPVSLQEMDHSVPLVFYDEYEELEHWRPFAYAVQGGQSDYPGSPAYSVTCFTQLCRLSLIMTRILNKVYAERSAKKGPNELAEDLKSLHADLETWKKELPRHLTFDPSARREGGKGSTVAAAVTPPPHVLSLLAMYNVLAILLHRPFVSDGHLHVNMRALAASSFLTCASAASTIVSLLRAYHAAFSTRRAPYLISYATYVAATILVRIATQPGRWGKEAKEALSTCLRVFEENQETNWAVKRARNVVEGLMKRMRVTLGSDQEEAEAAADSADAAVTQGDNNANGQNVSAGEDNCNEPAASSNHEQENAGAPDGGSRQQNAPLSEQSSGENAASFDIDAIISSFMSSQGPHTSPFPSVVTPSHHPYSSYHDARNDRQYHPPYQVYEAPAPAAGTATSLGYPWFEGNAGITPASSSPASTGHAALRPHNAFAPTPSSTHHQMGHYNFYPNQSHSMGSQRVVAEGGTRSDWQMRMASGGGSGTGDGLAYMNMNDMLFGFNSSAVEGIGWEFEGTGR